MDEEAAVGLVDGVDVVPDMEFTRSNVTDTSLFAVCYGTTTSSFVQCSAVQFYVNTVLN